MGLDLSLGMLRLGASTNRFPLCQGDMRESPFRDSVFAAIVAYYSIHNVTRTELGMVLAEAARVLRPGATLLLSTHLGEGECIRTTSSAITSPRRGKSLDSSLEIIEQVSSKGFLVRASEIRGPLNHEHQSQRIYLLANGAA